MKEKGKIVNILEVEEDDKERNRGAALLSIYNEFKDEIKAIRTAPAIREQSRIKFIVEGNNCKCCKRYYKCPHKQ